MSQENVEVIRAGYEAFARGDVDAVLSGLDPEIEVRPAPEFPGEDSYHGHTGFLAYSERWLESWEEYRLIPEEFIDVGDRMVVVHRAVGRGKGSGIDVDVRVGHLLTFRNGKVLHFVSYLDRGEALRAADEDC